MTPDELKALTLTTAAARIREGALSPVDLTRAVLDRIRSLNPRTNAFITVVEERALEEAEAAARALETGGSIGALHGVPVSLKDLVDTAGIPTTAASRVMAHRVPEADAAIVERLREAGAILIGKTNLHECAFGVTNVNPHYGPARNPWALDRMSGGSSGGSAVSVALSMALGSIGTDTGGSIRIPSALCGTVGLKPTFGRVSVRGVIPLAPSLDHVGPITRTVEDAARMLEVIAGFDPDDPDSIERDTPAYTETLDRGAGGLRLGVPQASLKPLEQEVEQAFEAAIARLESMGAARRDVALPDPAPLENIFKCMATTEAFDYHQRFLEESPEAYGDDVRDRMLAGRDVRAVDYVRADRERLALRSSLADLFRSIDLLGLPSVPITAPGIDAASVDWNGESEPLLRTLTRMTRLANLTGAPAISIPCGFSREGLPIGLQIVGREFEESLVLRAAYAYQESTDWHTRRPPM